MENQQFVLPVESIKVKVVGANLPQMPSFTRDDGILVDWKPMLLQSNVPLGHAEVPTQQTRNYTQQLEAPLKYWHGN